MAIKKDCGRAPSEGAHWQTIESCDRGTAAPGAGPKLAPRLLGEIGDDRERFDGDAQNLRNRPGRSRLAPRQFL
jgi:hypothetical protein